jgi:hypothetical protein
MDGDIRLVDNVFVKMIPLNGVGDKVKGHAHVFDHITLLSVGKVLMKHDNGEATHTAPCLIVTPKGITHEFISLTDFSLLSCIHAIRDGDDVDDIAPQNITEGEAMHFFSENPVTILDKKALEFKLQNETNNIA